MEEKRGREQERAVVFIDGNNLHNGLKDCYGIERLLLEPFCRHIIQGREFRGIYYADANFIQSRGTDNYAKQQEYFSYIKNIKGLRFRKGFYKKTSKVPVEKLSDVYLATDMVDLCHRDEFDYAYLVAGDVDYAPAIDIVVRQGKRVINVYFDTTTRNSYALRRHSQGFFKNITRQIAEQYKWAPKIKTGVPKDSGDPISK